MPRRENQIYKEAAALWISVRGEPPPEGLSGSELLMQVLERMDTRSYEQLRGAARHGRDIVWPIH